MKVLNSVSYFVIAAIAAVMMGYASSGKLRGLSFAKNPVRANRHCHS